MYILCWVRGWEIAGLEGCKNVSSGVSEKDRPREGDQAAMVLMLVVELRMRMEMEMEMEGLSET